MGYIQDLIQGLIWDTGGYIIKYLMITENIIYMTQYKVGCRMQSRGGHKI